ncbi:MAG: AAA-like domain-containing protein [Cyanobacteria bacterium J06554_3]
MTSSYTYKVGGSLPYDHPTYVERLADIELYSAIRQQQFCGVLGPAQTGKSSLRVQARRKLEHAGYCCASLYATQLLDSPKDYYRWDKQLTFSLWDSLFPEDISRFKQWSAQLEKTEKLLPNQRLEHFSRDLLFNKLGQTPIVIFFDDVEALLDIPFLIKDLLNWIRHCYLLRKIYPVYENLNFVMLGNFSKTVLNKSQPFTQIITPGRFELTSCAPLFVGLEPYVEEPSLWVEAIFRWTNGQPLLTQKLCQTIIRYLGEQTGSDRSPLAPFPEALNSWIDDLVQSDIIETWHQQDQLNYLWDMYHQLTSSPYKKQHLALSQRILLAEPVKLDGTPAQETLLLSGLAVEKKGHLQIANEVYRQIFQRLL